MRAPKKSRLFLIFLLIFSLPIINADPDIETLYVDDYNPILEEWDETGTHPWLNDDIENEIYTSLNGKIHGEFNYADHTGSETIISVTFYIELKGSSTRNDQVSCFIQIQNGGVWLEVLSQDPDADDYAWYSADISEYANTWDKINWAKLKIEYERVGSPSTQTIYARRSYLEIEYSPEEPDPEEPDPKSDPPNPPPYTERISTFAIAADGAWTDYNLTANQGMPKGRVAEIVCCNKNTGFARVAGVRTDGSDLNRYIDLHEAEGNGVTTATMFVKSNETTGLIECYSEIQGDIDFYLLGYFNSDFDFTESITNLGQPGLAWANNDLTGSGVPANAICQILMGNEKDNADYFAGVREKGSGFERGITLDEAEADGWTALSMIVRSDAGAVIEWKGGSITDVTMWILGWFNNNVGFVEDFTAYNPEADSTWESKTIDTGLANSVAVFALAHEDSGSETFCGLREEGSVLARMIESHEAEGGNAVGFEACINLDADKKCEVYCEDASESLFYFTGIFIEYPLLPTAIEQQRKVFKNPRGMGYYYRLQEDALGNWDFHYSVGYDWTDSGVGVTCTIGKQPSISIFEDASNSRLVVVVAYVAADGNLNVQAFAIADGDVTIATLWTSDSVDTPSIELYYPAICIDPSGYIWVIWTDRYYNVNYLRNRLRTTRTTTANPVAAPVWETIKDVWGEMFGEFEIDGLSSGCGPFIRASLLPLYAPWDGNTWDAAVVVNYYSLWWSDYFITGLPLDFFFGAILVGADVAVDSTVHPDLLSASVAETGAANDVFIIYKDANGDLLCRKWDLSLASTAVFGTIHSATDVDSLALAIDKNAAPDVLYAFYVKTGVAGDLFYKTTGVDAAAWSSEVTIDDDAEPLDYLSASYEDWNADGDVQVIWTRMTSKTVGFWPPREEPEVVKGAIYLFLMPLIVLITITFYMVKRK